MATITKTQGISVLSLQQILPLQIIKSTAQDVSDKLACTIFIHFALIDDSGPLSAGVEFRIEASPQSSGDSQWYPLSVYRTLTAAPASEPVNGTVSSSSDIVPVVSTNLLDVGDIVFFKNPTLGNSEWNRIKSVSTNASITLVDPLTNAQTGATLFDLAELYVAQIDLTSIGRIRFVADASQTNKSTVVEVMMVTGDSIS